MTQPLVITESNWQDQVGDGNIVEAGGEPRLLSLKPRNPGLYGSSRVLIPFEELGIDLIPEGEWDDRMRLAEEQQASPHYLVHGKMDPYDQARTNYCWVNSTACAKTINRVQMGVSLFGPDGRLLDSEIISAASMGAPKTNFQNIGGYLEQAMEQSMEVGACPISLWPSNAIDRTYWNKPEVQAALPNYKTTWAVAELNPRDMLRQCMTLILLGYPIITGYNWWGHSTLIVSAVPSPSNARKRAFREWNSWGKSYGENGVFYLEHGRGTPDSAIAFCRMTPYQG